MATALGPCGRPLGARGPPTADTHAPATGQASGPEPCCRDSRGRPLPWLRPGADGRRLSMNPGGGAVSVHARGRAPGVRTRPGGPAKATGLGVLAGHRQLRGAWLRRQALLKTHHSLLESGGVASSRQALDGMVPECSGLMSARGNQICRKDASLGRKKEGWDGVTWRSPVPRFRSVRASHGRLCIVPPIRLSGQVCSSGRFWKALEGSGKFQTIVGDQAPQGPKTLLCPGPGLHSHSSLLSACWPESHLAETKARVQVLTLP